MNLLGAKNYDPAGAVSKVTTSLIAMTAFDTTNLRIAFTVPSHGMVTVKMTCVHHGSTTTAQVLLGCLEGSTVRGRAPVTSNLLGTAVATTRTKLEASFTLTGLTPGAVNWDAAYGVEIVASANGAIKYGGPNNTTTDDAFGGFNFEIWDPQPQTTTGQLSVDSNGRVDVIKVAGTTQTAGDIAALINTLDDFVDTEIAAIKAKTDNLPSDPADASDIASSFTTVNGKLDTIDDFLDTEVAAIKAKTDNLPSDPADQSALEALIDALPTAAENADAVWDEDATGHQTQGTFGQAIGDPVADTNTIYKAVVTDASGTTVGADTTNALSRIPAALSGDGFMKADLKSIEDELTSGNNATLNLKSLNIQNNAGNAIYAVSTNNNGSGAIFGGNGTGYGVDIFGGQNQVGLQIDGGTLAGAGLGINSTAANFPAVSIDGAGKGVEIYGEDGDGVYVEAVANNGDGIHLVGVGSGKSINAPNDIAVSDGDLTLTAIANKVLASVIETGYTLKQSMRLMLSALAGKLSGAATTTVTIRNATDSKTRITATVDESGNRTAVVHDTTD